MEAHEIADRIISNAEQSFKYALPRDVVIHGQNPECKEDGAEVKVKRSGSVFCGDNMDALSFLIGGNKDFESMRGKIDLIYIDPPFFTNNIYTSKIYNARNGSNKFSELSEQDAYNDVWNDGIPGYLKMMAPRLILMRELLSERGSIYVHIDWHIGHYLKIIMDEIFGRNNFLNQIIWKKTNSPKSQKLGYGNQHDMILFYKKGASFIFHPPRKGMDQKYLKSFRYDDLDGRGPYQTVPLVAAGLQNTANRKRFEYLGVTAPWLYTHEKLDEFRMQRRLFKTKGGFRLKVYLNDMIGPTVSDLWTDGMVSPIQGGSLENAGFDTQKPESLVSRIIEASSNEDSIVADFFSGSGTTSAAAAKLGRKWVVAEANPRSALILRKRLLSSAPSCNFYCFADDSANIRRIQGSGKIPGDEPWIRIEKKDNERVNVRVLLHNIVSDVFDLQSGNAANNQISLVDYWAIDPSYNGISFIDRWRSFTWGKRGKSNYRAIETEAIFRYDAKIQNIRVGIKIFDLSGFETLIDIPLSI